MSAELLATIAAAADHCLKPRRHGVRWCEGVGPDFSAGLEDGSDLCLRLEARDGEGRRLPAEDLELEIYRSGSELNLMLTRVADEQAPVLWHGSHAVWMQASSGERCGPPPDGAPLESLARRLRALVCS